MSISDPLFDASTSGMVCHAWVCGIGASPIGLDDGRAPRFRLPSGGVKFFFSSSGPVENPFAAKLSCVVSISCSFPDIAGSTNARDLGIALASEAGSSANASGMSKEGGAACFA